MVTLRIALFAAASTVWLAACEDPSKKQPTAAVGPAATSTTAPSAAASETLAFSDQNSKIGFVGSKVSGSHEGKFEKFRGTIRLAGGKVDGSSVEADIDMDSLKIEPEKLLGHLKSPDFFDVARFPKATFKSTEIKAGGASGATHTVTGNLNLHGKEKSISFPATITVSDTEASTKAEFTINRKDFDIVYPGMPNDLIRDGVVLNVDLHAPRTKITPAKDNPH
ncbi:MAG TPA: YceI family protein [Polyangiaceae bacterium]